MVWLIAVGGVAVAAFAMLSEEAQAQTTGRCSAAHVRWASSSNTLYISGPSTCTLTSLRNIITSKSPALAQDAANAAIWYLNANLKLESGAKLVLHGTAIGGDVDELRLRSNNASTAGSIVYIRAQWGVIDMDTTKVTSWNSAVNGPDTEYTTYKRSYIHVRSYLDSDGVTARESRMDIKNSDVGYLGYYAAEAYGLVWKVYGSQSGLFDKVNVKGDIKNSRIHHNYFGVYTYGAYQMQWVGNVVENNVKYGLDPHDDSDALTIDGNISRNNGDHGIICSQRCDHLKITNNTVSGNKGNGIMLHRSVTDSDVSGNVVYNNTDAGVALFESFNNTVRNNNIYGNARGVRFSVGSHDNLIQDNTISNNSEIGIYAYQGSDAAQEPGSNGRPKKNTIDGNTISGSGKFMVKLRDSDDFVFSNNTFSGTAKMEFTAGVGNTLEGNSLPTNTTITTQSGTSPTGVYTAGQTTVENSRAVIAKIASDAVVEFSDPEGRIYDAEEKTDANEVSSLGSTLLLDSALIGTQSVVTPLPFWVSVSAGVVDITIKSWVPDSLLSWSAANGAGSRTVTFRVGNLNAGQRYAIDRNGVPMTNGVADADGFLSFSAAMPANAVELFELR